MLRWQIHDGRGPTRDLVQEHGPLQATDATHTLYAGTAADGIFKSTDNGQSWQAINTGLQKPDGSGGYIPVGINGIVVEARNPLKLYAATTAGMFHSIEWRRPLDDVQHALATTNPAPG